MGTIEEVWCDDHRDGEVTAELIVCPFPVRTRTEYIFVDASTVDKAGVDVIFRIICGIYKNKQNDKYKSHTLPCLAGYCSAHLPERNNRPQSLTSGGRAILCTGLAFAARQLRSVLVKYILG